MDLNIKKNLQKRIVIIGGGFAGIEFAKKLKNEDFQVILLDKNNYHTFQPLLYQVATFGLEPDSIAYPLRRLFHKSSNVLFRMAEVMKIIPQSNQLETSIGSITYDFLVIASGSTNNFFDFESISNKLMPMKSVIDALNLRSYILQNFEKALLTNNLSEQEVLMNVAIVGGGPTGVELAGALGEMKNSVLPFDYAELDLSKMQIHLFEASPKILSSMSNNASSKAIKYLNELGVKVWLHTKVIDYSDNIITTDKGEFIKTSNFIWTAGVKGKIIAGIEAKYIVGNRYKVDLFNKLEGYENIYAIGDVSAMITVDSPKGFPMLASVAIEQGINLANNFLRLRKNKNLIPFNYKNSGTMATVGRNRAVVDLPFFSFQGTFAWFVWMLVHILSLIGFRNKLMAFFGWVYNYFTYDRAIRLIIRPFNRD